MGSTSSAGSDRRLQYCALGKLCKTAKYHQYCGRYRLGHRSVFSRSRKAAGGDGGPASLRVTKEGSMYSQAHVTESAHLLSRAWFLVIRMAEKACLGSKGGLCLWLVAKIGKGYNLGCAHSLLAMGG